MAKESVTPINADGSNQRNAFRFSDPLNDLQASIDNAQGIVAVLINEFACAAGDDGMRHYSDTVVLQLTGSLQDLLMRMHEKSMQTWDQCVAVDRALRITTICAHPA